MKTLATYLRVLFVCISLNIIVTQLILFNPVLDKNGESTDPAVEAATAVANTASSSLRAANQGSILPQSANNKDSQRRNLLIHSSNETGETNKVPSAESTPTDAYHRPRTAIPLGQQRPSSFHFCTTPQGMLPLYRSCHFTDVCFDSKGTMLYFHDGNEGETPPTTEELKTAIRVQSRIQCPRKDCERPDDSYLQPRIIISTDKENSSDKYHKIWSPIPFAMPYVVFNGKNFGHAIGDNVLPFYRLLKLFGVYSDTVDFLPLRYDCDESGTCSKDGRAPAALTKVMDPFLLSSGQSQNEKSVVDNGEFHKYFEKMLASENTAPSDSSSVLCFENVLSGRYLLSDHGEDENAHGRFPEQGTNSHFIGKGDILTDFRRDYMRRIGINENADMLHHCQECDTPSHYSHVSGSDVIILTRPENTLDGGWNSAPLLEMMQKEGCLGPARKVRVLDVRKLSMKAQVQAAATAKVMISMVGGASLLSWFLPPGATTILLQRNNVTLDSHVYDNLPYLHKYEAAPIETKYGPAGKTKPHFVFDYQYLCFQAKQGIRHYETTLQSISPPCGGTKCTLRQ